MKWFKKNWLVALVIGLMIYILINSVVRNENYKREISHRSDSLAVLKYQYSELEKEALLSSELVSAYQYADSVYRDSLQGLRIDYFKQKQRYEKQVTALKLIPTDDIYIDVTGWLDSLSVQW